MALSGQNVQCRRDGSLGRATGKAWGTERPTFRPALYAGDNRGDGARARAAWLCARTVHDFASGLDRTPRPDDRGRIVVPAILFPETGETTWRESCDRRGSDGARTVGVYRRSTLGKIDVQGGTLRFSSTSSTLTLCRRYRGQGALWINFNAKRLLMDDGTCARLGASISCIDHDSAPYR